MNWLTQIEIGKNTAITEGIIDNYLWHQKIWDCFPDDKNHKRDFLFRIKAMEHIIRIYILSHRKSVCPHWCLSDNFAVKKISPTFLSHRYYVFDLWVNPIRCIAKFDSDGKRKKSGKRIPLTKKDELSTWISRKGTLGGFKIHGRHPLYISSMVENYFEKRSKGAYHGGVQFRGILQVTDSDKFKETYCNGIGSAKGFGFGMLLLLPINL